MSIKTENESDEIERLLNEKRELINRRKEGMLNTRIPYLEEIAKLKFPDSFDLMTNITEEDFIVVRNGHHIKALCKDCERADYQITGDFGELGKYCLTTSEGIWTDAEWKPQTQLRHETETVFKQHQHPSVEKKGAYIQIVPYMKIRVKDEPRFYQLWHDCWTRQQKMKIEVLTMQKQFGFPRDPE